LVIIKETAPDGKTIYINVKGILPLPTGVAAPKIPVDFVRAKDKKNQPASAAAPAATQAAAPEVEVADEDIPF